MQLKIGNIMALIPLIGSLWIFITLRTEVIHVLSCLAKMGPGYDLNVRLTGLIAMGLIVLGVVCFARLISAERSNDRRR